VWDKGEYTKYATAEHRRIGDNLRNTPTGREQFDKLVNHAASIQTVINTTDAPVGKNGGRVNGEMSGEAITNRATGKTTLKSGTIKLFEKNIEKSAIRDGVSTDERMSATTGHEIEHTTDENIRIGFDNATTVEDEPKERTQEIINEYRDQKPILNPDKNYYDVFPRIEVPKLFYGGGW
jgi:hypothetical protein